MDRVHVSYENYIALINKTVVETGLRIYLFILTAGIITQYLRSKSS